MDTAQSIAREMVAEIGWSAAVTVMLRRLCSEVRLLIAVLIA